MVPITPQANSLSCVYWKWIFNYSLSLCRKIKLPPPALSIKLVPTDNKGFDIGWFCCIFSPLTICILLKHNYLGWMSFYSSFGSVFACSLNKFDKFELVAVFSHHLDILNVSPNVHKQVSRVAVCMRYVRAWYCHWKVLSSSLIFAS